MKRLLAALCIMTALCGIAKIVATPYSSAYMKKKRQKQLDEEHARQHKAQRERDAERIS